MGIAVDPTYPLYPVCAVLAAVMLLLVLLTSFIRQNWNLGIAFLCFWLFLDNITLAVNAVIWSDNYDVKLIVYCDIGDLVHRFSPSSTHSKTCTAVSHLQLLCYIVRPITTLLVTRRLYLIARLQSVELPSKKAVSPILGLLRTPASELIAPSFQRRWNLFAEWSLGLVVPVLVAGPICKSMGALRPCPC